jgi:hypothetical protein
MANVFSSCVEHVSVDVMQAGFVGEDITSELPLDVLPKRDDVRDMSLIAAVPYRLVQFADLNDAVGIDDVLLHEY